MLLPLIISYIYNENQHIYFLIPIFTASAIGIFSIKNKYSVNEISYREAVLLVTLTWIFVSLFGAIPFYLTEYFPNFIDAFFESISGFTATGSTVLKDIESLPKSILFWRSETHWLGGMGIIALAIVILPKLRGNKFLFEAEAPIPPEGGKLFARTTDIAKAYWKIYIILTLFEILLLLPAMKPFDAITHAFSSIAGGGFSTKNNSIAFFDSVYIELVLSLFMIAGATSFILHFQAINNRVFNYLKSTSFKIFISVIIFSTLLITLNLFLNSNYDSSFFESIRMSFFQVVSIITTTGFATENFKYWPQVSQIVLVLLMFVGGMSASTSGAIKVSRLEVLYKDMKNIFKTMLHPKAVQKVRIDYNSLKPDKIEKVYLFILAYIFVFLTAGLLIIFDNNSIVVAYTAVASTLGNVGPGFAEIGPFDNFAQFSVFSKLILSLCMLFGRLEIWTVLLLFSKYFWSI